MIPIPDWENQLKQIKDEQNNRCCFECGTESVTWASVNNGIFLCLKCSGIHRTFGVHISFIRSIELDSWNEKQIKTMELGGNLRLRDFLDSFTVPRDGPMDFKYKTYACHYYRELLKSRVNETDPPERITREQGLMLVENLDKDLPQNSRTNSTPGKNEGSGKKSANIVEEAFDRTSLATKQAFEKIKNTDIKLEMKSIGTNVANKTKQFGNKTAELAKESAEKIKNFWKKKKAQRKEKGQEPLKFNEKDESLQTDEQNEQMVANDNKKQKTNITDDIKKFGNTIASKTKDFGEKTANMAKEAIDKMKKKKEPKENEEEVKVDREPLKEKSDEKPKTSIGGYFKNFLQSTKEKTEKLGDKIKEQHIGDKISDASRKFSASVKGMVSKKK